MTRTTGVDDDETEGDDGGEVEQDNKKLAHQIEDKVNQLRKSGMM